MLCHSSCPALCQESTVTTETVRAAPSTVIAPPPLLSVSIIAAKLSKAQISGRLWIGSKSRRMSDFFAVLWRKRHTNFERASPIFFRDAVSRDPNEASRSYTLGLLHAELAGKLLSNKREAIRLRNAMLQVEAVGKNAKAGLQPSGHFRKTPKQEQSWLKRGTLFGAPRTCCGGQVPRWLPVRSLTP
jgi:hypothetical protein